MHTKRSCDELGEDSDNEPICPPRRSKQRRCNNGDHEKYDAIFKLLTQVEERGARMELHAIENKKEALEQAQRALDSYNALSERILHAIVNIGGRNEE